MSAEIKAFSNVEIKSESEGKVLAHFATYDEIDHHDDITRKGAFEDGAPIVVSSYNHTSWGGALPVGKGVIRDGANGAVADLQFFMNTQAGRDTFETVKNLGKLQQWSYGFDVKQASREDVEDTESGGQKNVRVLEKVKVHEVSPVLLGAGKSTRTLAVKNGALTMDKLEAAGYSVEDIIELLEEKAKKPKPKPGDKDDNKKPKPGDKKPSTDEDDEEDEDEDDKDPKKPNGKKPTRRGKMRMSDQTDEVVTSLQALADRAEEIVTLRKADGKPDVSEPLQEQFAELLKQADRIFDLMPQDEDGYLETKALQDHEEVQSIYLSLLSEEL